MAHENKKRNTLLQIYFSYAKMRSMTKITTAHRLYMRQVETRKAKVRKMRAAGFKWREIGAALGITWQRAQQLGRVAK